MLKKNSFLSFAFLLLLIAAIAFCAVSCNNDKIYDNTEFVADEAETVGSGSKEFAFIAQLSDGTIEYYKVKTDKEKVGEALVEQGLISGEDGPYGLYVLTVAGETLDYTSSGMYWGFYINGEFASTGVDMTNIDTSAVYKLAASK